MAGVNETPVSAGINWGGRIPLGSGACMYVGSGVFVTTGTTVVCNHPFGSRKILSVQVNPTGSSANDLPYIVAGTSANQLTRDTTYGWYTSVTPGKFTIGRQSSGTSGGGFMVTMIARDS